MRKNVIVVKESGLSIQKQLDNAGIRVTPIKQNDEDILNLIDQIDLNIEYWKIRGTLYEQRIKRLRKLKADLWFLIQ